MRLEQSFIPVREASFCKKEREWKREHKFSLWQRRRKTPTCYSDNDLQEIGFALCSLMPRTRHCNHLKENLSFLWHNLRSARIKMVLDQLTTHRGNLGTPVIIIQCRFKQNNNVKVQLLRHKYSVLYFLLFHDVPFLFSLIWL